MPRAAQHGEDLKIFGGCIFKDYEFIGIWEKQKIEQWL